MVPPGVVEQSIGNWPGSFKTTRLEGIARDSDGKTLVSESFIVKYFRRKKCGTPFYLRHSPNYVCLRSKSSTRSHEIWLRMFSVVPRLRHLLLLITCQLNVTQFLSFSPCYAVCFSGNVKK